MRTLKNIEVGPNPKRKTKFFLMSYQNNTLCIQIDFNTYI